MDLIQILKERVIPIVLNQEQLNQNNVIEDPNTTNEKKTTLGIFFPILLFILRSKPELISALQDNLNPRLSDVFGHNEKVKETLLSSLQQSLPKAEIEKLLNRSIAPTLSVLEDLAGSNHQQDILHYLNQNRELIRGTLPVWALSILSALGISLEETKPNLASPVVVAPNPETIQQQEVENRDSKQDKKRTNRILLPMIALVILGLLGGYFLIDSTKQKQNLTVSEPPVIDQELAFFQLITDKSGSLVSCQARIGNPTFTDALQQNIKKLFNHPMGCGVDATSKYRDELVDQTALSNVVKLVHGVPNITMTWTGAEISLQGSDEAVIKDLASQVKPLVPNVNVVYETLLDPSQQAEFDGSEAVEESIQQAQTALDQITSDKISSEDIVKALNLQIINFASASHDIPQSNKAVLDKASGLIKQIPDLHLIVKGYTDSTGNSEANKQLSKERAQSVVDYLVVQGVNSSQLKAEGFGQEKPIADNTTAEGQFKNRRIEFEVSTVEVNPSVADKVHTEKK